MDGEQADSSFSLKTSDSEGSSNELFSDDCQVIKVHRAIDQSFKYFVITKVASCSYCRFSIQPSKGEETDY